MAGRVGFIGPGGRPLASDTSRQPGAGDDGLRFLGMNKEGNGNPTL